MGIVFCHESFLGQGASCLSITLNSITLSIDGMIRAVGQGAYLYVSACVSLCRNVPSHASLCRSGLSARPCSQPLSI